MMQQRQNLCIAMVSDFFYPNMGGVESHIFCLAQQLIQRGHNVIVLTHTYKDRVGIRYLYAGKSPITGESLYLKVYHISITVLLNECTIPNYLLFFPAFFEIVKRERVQIVHAHQAFSCMAHEALMHARTMGLECVFTDHSLFGFSDASSILTNKLLKFCLVDVSKVICVSHISKENTVLRAKCKPSNVYVIPNAIHPASFKPDLEKRSKERITIVVVSRLVYRKGTDLLVQVIPLVCRLFPQVIWIIGGDGPKRLDLEQMLEKEGLQHRVQMLGRLLNDQVPGVLQRGHIFLNCSLTEAFCIAIVEAACAGLLVVSTRVGGIPEVLPRDMLLLTDVRPEDIVKNLSLAIEKVGVMESDFPFRMHERVAKMYSWQDVAERTERVYLDPNNSNSCSGIVPRLKKTWKMGILSGKVFCLGLVVEYWVWRFLEWLYALSNAREKRIVSRQSQQVSRKENLPAKCPNSLSNEQ